MAQQNFSPDWGSWEESMQGVVAFFGQKFKKIAPELTVSSFIV